jgi:hypothetical protein
MKFRAYTVPDNDVGLLFTSSDPDVVSIEQDPEQQFYGGPDVWMILKFKKAGKATITLTSKDGAFSKAYNITVKAKFDCDPGKDKLTPGEFAYYATRVGGEIGVNTAYMVESYLYLWLTEDKLTWEIAKEVGESNAKREYWLDQEKAGAIWVYAGWDEEKNAHLFFHGGGSRASGTSVYLPAEPGATGNIRFPVDTITMMEGTTGLVSVSGNTNGEFVTYTSSNPNVVQASGEFLLAKNIGEAIITATYKGQTATIKVTVTRDPSIQRVVLNKETLRISTYSEAYQLTLYRSGIGQLTWTSSDPSVAMVDENGWVSSRGPGECIITVTDGVNSDTCTVYVSD